MNDYKEIRAICADDLKMAALDEEYLVPKIDISIIDTNRIAPIVSYHILMQNPDLSDGYVNHILRSNNGVSHDSNLISPEMQSKSTKSIARSIFSIFKSESKLTIEELPSDILRKKFALQKQGVIVPLQLENEHFDTELYSEQELANNGL